MKNNKGFSLVELIVVIAIMAILAAVAIPTFSGFITKANKAADEDFMNQAKYAIELANAADPYFELATVSVTVDANGDFTKVTYNAGSAKDIPETVTDVSTLDDEIADARSAIDWDYKFKAKDNKSKVVTLTKGNDGKWTLSTADIPA